MHKIVTMIIDSEPFFRAGVRQALAQHEEFEIIECDPGDEDREAIAGVTASSPDVVLLSIGYPTLTGLALGKRIARGFPATKVVVLSTNPEENDEELLEVIKTGAVAYLRSKTCTPEQLIETIKRASRGEYPINDYVSSRPEVARRVLRQFQEIAAMGIMTVEDITTPLSSKEVQILTHIAEGNTNKRIASLLGISEQTIKNHVSAILRKLNANDRAHAVFLALRSGWISVEVGNNGKNRGEHIVPESRPQ